MRAEYQRCANESTRVDDGQTCYDESDLHDDPSLSLPGDLVDHVTGEHRGGDADQRICDDDREEDEQVDAVGPGEPEHPLPGTRRELALGHRAVAAVHGAQRAHGVHVVHRHGRPTSCSQQRPATGRIRRRSRYAARTRHSCATDVAREVSASPPTALLARPPTRARRASATGGTAPLARRPVARPACYGRPPASSALVSAAASRSTANNAATS